MIKQAKITSPEQQLQKVKIMANLDFTAEQWQFGQQAFVRVYHIDI